MRRKEEAVIESCRWLRLTNIYRTGDGDKAYLIQSEDGICSPTVNYFNKEERKLWTKPDLNQTSTFICSTSTVIHNVITLLNEVECDREH